MAARKPLAEGCTGTATCPIPDHTYRPGRGHRRQTTHVPLTPGQRKTLAERAATTREAAV
jgi:hypothetical protein